MSVIRYNQVDPVTPLDRILRAWLKDKLDTLSESDQRILDRISEVEKRYRKGYTVKQKAWNVLDGSAYEESYKRPYRRKELADWQVKRFGVSLRQAYEDIRMAEQFFLYHETRNDKEFARGQMIMWGEELMYEAKFKGEFRAAAAFFKELRLLKGLDKFEDETFDPSKFEPINPIIITDPSEIGFEKMENPTAVVEELKKSLKKSVLDKILDDAEDIEDESEKED